MFPVGMKFTSTDNVIVTIKDIISPWSYIVEMKKLNKRNQITHKGFKIADELEIKNKDIYFFMDKNREKK